MWKLVDILIIVCVMTFLYKNRKYFNCVVDGDCIIDADYKKLDC